jgi:hypothetical protein
MGKTEFLVIFLAICMLVSGLGASQGMGGSKAYDQSGYNWMGTPVYSDDGVGTAAEDYFSPYGFSGAEEGSSGSRINAVSVQIEAADPVGVGLVVGGDDSLMNQIYLQTGNQLLTQGTALLGEEYTLWVKVSMRGSFQLYDYERLMLSRDSLTPGWYRINGTYGNYVGQHLHRFLIGGISSNDLNVVVSSGGYPTSFSVTGRVVDRNGQGISGADVILTNSDGGRISTTTDPAGFYALDVANGVYMVSAEHPGYTFTQGSVQATSGLVSASRPLFGAARAASLPPIFE